MSRLHWDYSRVGDRTLLEAELNLSNSRREAYYAHLHAIAPNPFEEGRKNQEAMWDARLAETEPERLIWC